MKLTIKRENFLKALNYVNQIIPSKSVDNLLMNGSMVFAIPHKIIFL